MVFQASSAKREILRKLAERDWTSTDLAEELGKSPATVYNHLDDLHERGLLTKRQVAAKTRPKTEYSIGDGLLQYIAVLPGLFVERSLSLTPEKVTTFRIWALPQDEFHPFVQRYWWTVQTSAEIGHADALLAVAIYGSVARGDADHDSDIDVLVLTNTESMARTVENHFGTIRIQTQHGSKLAMTEVYTTDDYRESVAKGSDFLRSIQEEIHIIHDPENVLRDVRGTVST